MAWAVSLLLTPSPWLPASAWLVQASREVNQQVGYLKNTHNTRLHVTICLKSKWD